MVRRSDLKQQSQYESAGGSVIGTDPNYPAVRTLPLADGRFLDAGDLQNRSRVVVLGQKSAALLFPGGRRWASRILLNGTRFQVVGVAEKTGRGNDDGTNQQIYIPLTTMLEMFPIKGENLPQNALSSIQYQPRVHGENESARPRQGHHRQPSRLQPG